MSTRSSRPESLGASALGDPFGNVLHPESEEQLREALLYGAKIASPMAPLGTGSSVRGSRIAQAAGTAPVTWLSTRSLIPHGESGIIEYVPGDGTVTAHAGTSWATLRDAVRAGGHRLTPAIHGDATLGGVIGGGRSGLDRCAFGPVRHHVLGLAVMDGSGRVARSGGRLVKNVTGFDLHRVHTGARGSLGVILEASMRLMPIPKFETLIESEPEETAALAVEAALAVRSHPGIGPRGLFTVGRSLFVHLAGRSSQVETERGRVLELLRPRNEITGPDAQERSLELGAASPWIRILCRPSNCAAIVSALADAGGDASGNSGLLRVEPDAALIDWSAQAVESLPEDFWARAARAIGELGGLIDVRCPEDATARFLPEAAPPAHPQWTKRLAAAFDPGNVLRLPR